MVMGEVVKEVKEISELVIGDGGFPTLDLVVQSFVIHERDGIVVARIRLQREHFLL